MKNKKYFLKNVYKKCIHRSCLIIDGRKDTTWTLPIGGSPTRGVYPHCPIIFLSFYICVIRSGNYDFVILDRYSFYRASVEL